MSSVKTTITRKTTDGLIWNTLQKLASKGLQLIFSILIARILIPEQYGLVAIASLFIALSDVIIDSGFSKALLRKESKTVEDYSTVFWFNIVVSILLYLILFFFAPLIGIYYGSSILVSVIRVISLSLIINAICGIQSLHLIADMDFKKLAILESLSMLIGGMAALFLAIRGMGVWALVGQTIIGCIVRTGLLWAFSKWKPVFVFSIVKLKEFFSFGSRLLVSEFAGRLYGSLFIFAIGKEFSSDNLGLYGKADAFASTPSSIVTGPLGSVTFPAIAQIQSEEERLYKNYIAMICLSAFVIFPVFIGLTSIADLLVPVILTEKWNGMIVFLQILSVSYLFSSLAVIPQNYLLVFGESTRILYIQIISKTVGLILLFPLLKISLVAVCLDIALVSFVSLLMTLFYLNKVAKYKFVVFIKSVFPALLMSIVMGGIVYGITIIAPANPIALLLGIVVGIFLYCIEAYFFQREHLLMIVKLFMPYFHKIKR